MKRLQEGEQWSALIDYTILAAGYVQVSFTKHHYKKQCFGSGFSQVSGSGSRRAKMTQKNMKKFKKFLVLKC